MTSQAELRLDDIDPRYLRHIQDYLARFGLNDGPFRHPVPPADEMFFKALLPNLEGDRNIAAFKFVEAGVRRYIALEQIVRQIFGDFDQLRSVLDFASGYGRLTRILSQVMPPERLWVSDIYTQAIDWQVAHFGVNGFHSVAEPTNLAHDRRHDVVFVGSLFSHLPARLFYAWLERLYALVAEGGVIAFSVHDEAMLGPGETMDETGIRYFRWSESDSLDPDIYGMSYVTEGFVAEAIRRLPGSPEWRRFPKGLYENQDLYVVAGPGRDLANLTVASPVLLGLEVTSCLPTGDVDLAGWCIERTPGAEVQAIRVYADGAHVADVTLGEDRPDVLARFPQGPSMGRGWRVRLERTRVPTGAHIRLEAVSTTGVPAFAYAEMPNDPAMTYSGWSRRNLR